MVEMKNVANCVTNGGEGDEIKHVTSIVTNFDGVVAFPTDTLYGIACSIQSRIGFGTGSIILVSVN